MFYVVGRTFRSSLALPRREQPANKAVVSSERHHRAASDVLGRHSTVTDICVCQDVLWEHARAHVNGTQISVFV